MKRHFSYQTSEYSRLQQQITSLKVEKNSLQNQLIALQRRISNLEMQVVIINKCRIVNKIYKKGSKGLSSGARITIIHFLIFILIIIAVLFISLKQKVTASIGINKDRDSATIRINDPSN
jgi:hypothetical protein